MKTFSKIAKFLITALLLYWVVHKIDWASLHASLQLIKIPYLALSFFLFVTLFFTPAFLQHLLFKACAININAFSIYHINIISIFYSLVVPGDVAAGVARFLKFSNAVKNKATTPPEFLKQKVLLVMLTDRLMQTAALSFLAFVFLIPSESIPHRKELLLSSAVITLILLLFIFKGEYVLRTLGFLSKYLPQNWRDKISPNLSEAKGLPLPVLICCFIIALLYQFLLALLVDRVLSLGFNMTVPLVAFLGISLIIRFVRMIPITLSGIGVREGLYPYFLAVFGITHESAFLLGLFGSFLLIGAGLLGGLLEIIETIRFRKSSS